MAYNRLTVLLTTVVLSLILLTDCTGRTEQAFRSEIGSKSELVVAMDTDMPGYFAFGDEDRGRYYDVMQAYADKLGVTLRIITGNTHAQCRRMLEEGAADIALSLGRPAGETSATPAVYHVINISSGEDRPRDMREPADAVHVAVALSPAVKGLRDDFSAWLEAYNAQQEQERAELAAAETAAKNRRISQYDDVIRRVADREGLDWRFLSAIAYHESRFKSHVVSNKGAQGIMQIMPVVARNFNVPVEKVADTETNVMLAAKLLKNIEKSIQLPAGTSYKDRMSIVLACYNAGVGHIADARRLAKKHGRSANRWEDVSHFLQLKSQPEYYGDEVVRNGIFNGSKQTLAFVRNVMGQYDDYCLLAQK